MVGRPVSLPRAESGGGIQCRSHACWRGCEDMAIGPHQRRTARKASTARADAFAADLAPVVADIVGAGQI
jgi:hypothetical protein